MRSKILTVLLFLLASGSFAQVSYTGFIDKYPIELVTDIYSDGIANAIYVYTNSDDPITLTGKKSNDTLIFYEKDKTGKNSASLTFLRFDSSQAITGTWMDLKTKKELPITLTREFDVDANEGDQWKEREIIQAVSLKDKYFKLVLSKDRFEPRVTSVKIFEKKTDKLIQQIEMDCEFRGLNSLSTGDFNFDGLIDFSVFESSYAGPNTSSLYFLYDPKTNTYFDSGFTGVSLDFDNKSKRISEHNQCCAGRQFTTAIYKVVKNKMILVEQHCFIWDEKKEDLVERKMKYCE